MAKFDEFEVTTGFLTEALVVDGGLWARQVTITASPGQAKEASIHFDPNACSLDRFGDPEICTLIAVRSLPATLRLVEEREGKELYAIEAKGYGGPPLRLALVPSGDAKGETIARLLVLADDGGISRLITMEPSRGRVTAAA